MIYILVHSVTGINVLTSTNREVESVGIPSLANNDWMKVAEYTDTNVPDVSSVALFDGDGKRESPVLATAVSLFKENAEGFMINEIFIWVYGML